MRRLLMWLILLMWFALAGEAFWYCPPNSWPHLLVDATVIGWSCFIVLDVRNARRRLADQRRS